MRRSIRPSLRPARCLMLPCFAFSTDAVGRLAKARGTAVQGGGHGSLIK